MSATPTVILEQLTAHAPLMIFAKDLAGRYLFVNDLFAQLYGAPAERIIGRTDAELFPPAIAEGFERGDQRVLETRETFEQLERIIIPTTGELRIAQSTKFPLFERETLFGVGGIAFDVTERERSRAALERSEQRYRSVVDHSPTAYVAFDPIAGTFVDANERATQLFGLPLPELLKRGPAQLSPELQADGRRSEDVAREHIIAALGGERRVFDWIHLTATGEPIPCNIWIDGIEDGGRKLARAFLVDLRDIIAARRALDRQQALLTQSQTLARVGGWEFDARTRTWACTGEMASLFTALAGHDAVLARVSTQGRAQLEQALERAAAGQPFDLELELDRDVPVRRVRLVSEGARSGGPLTGWAQEVTEQRLLEARLRQSSKMDAVGRLAGGVAHDFNNMLSAILSSAHLLELRLASSDPEVSEALDTISKAAEQAAALTGQLLAFSRQQPVTREPVALGEVLRDATLLLERTLDRRITIEQRVDADLPRVEGDANSLKNVLLNLGINARDAMPSGGRLTLEARVVELDATAARALDPLLTAGRWVTVAVTDTGVGIAPEHRFRLFEPFFTTKAVGRGTGLGLATAYATLREHEGALTVDSRPGEGARFTLWLRPAREEVPHTEKPAAARARRRSGTVLLVDDERLVRRSTRRFLELLGFRVLEAADGLEAETALKAAGRVDLVMLDLVMPGRAPDETLTALRALQPEVPVLICSGYAPDQLTTTVFSFSRVARLQKPWAEVELNAALDELLG